MRFLATDKHIKIGTVLVVALALLLTLAVPNDPAWLHALKGTAFVVCALWVAWSPGHGQARAPRRWLAVGGIILGGTLGFALLVWSAN